MLLNVRIFEYGTGVALLRKDSKTSEKNNAK